METLLIHSAIIQTSNFLEGNESALLDFSDKIDNFSGLSQKVLTSETILPKFDDRADFIQMSACHTELNFSFWHSKCRYL